MSVSLLSYRVFNPSIYQLSFELIFLTSRSFASLILLIFLHVRVFQRCVFRALIFILFY